MRWRFFIYFFVHLTVSNLTSIIRHIALWPFHLPVKSYNQIDKAYVHISIYVQTIYCLQEFLIREQVVYFKIIIIYNWSRFLRIEMNKCFKDILNFMQLYKFMRQKLKNIEQIDICRMTYYLWRNWITLRVVRCHRLSTY